MSQQPVNQLLHRAVPAAGRSPRAPEDLSDRVSAAVLAVPGVAGLHTGPFGEVATYLPGRRVEGVQIDSDRCAVHLALYWGFAALETADRVRTALSPLVGTRVDVIIEDVVLTAPPE